MFTQIKDIHTIMPFMIVFDIVHAVRLYLLEKRLGYYPQEFLQVYVISAFRHIGETRLIDEG